MWTPEKSVLIVAESGTRSGRWLYTTVVAFMMFMVAATMSSAVILSVFADTTLLIQAADGSTIEQPTYVGDSIEKLWQAFFSSLSALIGLLGGKVL